MILRSLLVALVVGLSVPSATASPPPPPAGINPAHLADHLRALLLANLPDPIVSTEVGWGRQKEVVVGMKFHREGRIRVSADPIKRPRNDGLWQKIRIYAVDPQRTLGFGITNVHAGDPGAVTFDAYVALDVRLEADQQLWKSGMRLYSGDARGRCRAAVKASCEVTSRLEPKSGSILPAAILRVRVTKAELFYDDLVCEHILGLDGKPAAKVGEAAHRLMREFKPSLEGQILARANAAIVKAADTQEVRLELDRLLVVK